MYVLSKANNTSMSRIAAIMRSSMAPRNSGSVNIDPPPLCSGGRSSSHPLHRERVKKSGCETRDITARLYRLDQRLRPPAIFSLVREWLHVWRHCFGKEFSVLARQRRRYTAVLTQDHMMVGMPCFNMTIVRCARLEVPIATSDRFHPRRPRCC